jgi:hypothetical protein
MYNFQKVSAKLVGTAMLPVGDQLGLGAVIVHEYISVPVFIFISALHHFEYSSVNLDSRQVN